MQRLKAQNQHVTMVKAGEEFSKTDGQEYSYQDKFLPPEIKKKALTEFQVGRQFF